MAAGHAPLSRTDMPYDLPGAISFCEVAGTIVFLDVNADRYFCLSAGADRSFRRLTRGEVLDPQDERGLSELRRQGILVPSAGDVRPRPCAPLPRPTSSLLDEPGPGALGWEGAKAAAAIFATRLALRTLKLRRVLGHLAGRKRRFGEPAARGPEALRSVAAAFERSGLLAAPLDRCLPRSIALVLRLLDLGFEASLVIGVRTRPFAAHSWVQHGDRLLNDHIDQVRNFTPILIV